VAASLLRVSPSQKFGESLCSNKRVRKRLPSYFRLTSVELSSDRMLILTLKSKFLSKWRLSQSKSLWGRCSPTLLAICVPNALRFGAAGCQPEL